MRSTKFLDEAMFEAHRFLAAAETARAALIKENEQWEAWKKDKSKHSGSYPAKAMGAAKRASMDLSRKLTELRR